MPEITQEALTDLLKKAGEDGAKAGADAAIRAMNTVDPQDRPGQGSAPVSNVNFKRPARISLAKAIIALREGNWKHAPLEQELSDAAKEKYGSDEPRGFALPSNPFPLSDVLEAANAPVEGRAALRDYAVRAMSEGTTSAGGALVPAQYLQDLFVLSLQTGVAFRNAPGVESIPVASNVVYLPRETVMPSSAAYAEAGTLSATDATFAQQSITIKKQAAYSQFSNELLADATPAFEAYIAKTLARSLALFQDLQFLEGSGSGNNVTGMGSYSGLTTGYTAATNGDSYSAAGAADLLINLLFSLRIAGVEPNAWIMHPRVLQSVSKIKDSQNRYVVESIGGVFGAPVAIPNVGQLQTAIMPTPPVWRAQLLGIPVLLTSQIPITETQGSATNATHVYVGDFSFARVLDRQTIEMAISEHIAFTTDQTAVRVTGRAAPVLLAPAAFTKQVGIIP